MARIQIALAAVVLIVAVAVVVRDPARRQAAMEDVQDFLDLLRGVKRQT